MDEARLNEILSQLTLEEKAAMTTGGTKWHTLGVEGLGIRPVRTSDGPHGLRVERESHMGQVPPELEGMQFSGNTVHATCFPAACATAASFDRELLFQLGAELGKQAGALGVDVLLGPGINIKRTPLCGRNFEYFSEDPCLTGELAAAYVAGVQSQGVGTSLKHFAANNQEHRRLDYSAEMDERTLREIYLPAFETVVKQAKPWTVMASYNRIGGVHSVENKTLLTDILREEWGFDGVVISDWGAVRDRVQAVLAGCDLAMPGKKSSQILVDAVRQGRLKEEDLDACCRRVITLAEKAAVRKSAPLDLPAGHALARKLAAGSMVLLKNEEARLPLDPAVKAAYLGEFARTPRFQGGGSSCVETHMVTSPLEQARKEGISVSFAPGYLENGATTEALLAEAEALAREAEVAVVFVGLTDSAEVESFDRSHLRLSPGHDRLVERVCDANPNTVVVLMLGAPAELPWVERPKAILNTYLGGEAVGEALIDVLYGRTNPSGHLPETFPLRLEDTPAYLCYPGEGDMARYDEGLFVGYRHYTCRDMAVLFPFGHGLSYTSFAYTDLTLDKKRMDDTQQLQVRLKVKNTGSRQGKALVQLYVAPERNPLGVLRPVRELKDFAQVALLPDQEREVTFTLPPRAFAHWEKGSQSWKVEAGDYRIQIGENARDMCLTETLRVEGVPLPPPGGYTQLTPLGLLLRHPEGRAFLDRTACGFVDFLSRAGYMPKQSRSLLADYPKTGSLAALMAFDRQTDAPVGCMQILAQLSCGMLEEALPEAERKEFQALLARLNG